MPLSVPHLKTPNRSMVVYNPSHPAVIFGKIKSGVILHWNQNRMVRSVHRWLRPSKPKKDCRTPQQIPKRSGLIIPEPGKSFMLIQTSDAMSDLLAENNRLRNMVDDLIRQDRRDNFINLRH